MSKALQKVEKELENEMVKQIDIIYSSTAISLYRHWGWKKLHIARLFATSQAVWRECASTNEFSMLEMLENSTGIEMKIKETDKGWRELPYLNAKIKVDKLSVEKFIYMRTRQKLWVGAQVTACIFLALNRREGFGFIRLMRLMEQIDELRTNLQRNELMDVCLRETGIDIRKGVEFD